MAYIQREQFKPVEPNFISLTTHFSSPSADNQHQHLSERKTKRIKKCVTWCGCITAILLLFIVILIVLAFTVYNVKDPEVNMNGVYLMSGNFNRGSNNVTIYADMSVKNTNSFTFRYGAVNTSVFYNDIEFGSGLTPPGKAKAQRTKRFNITLLINPEKLVDNQEWITDIRNQGLNFSTYTKLSGKVKILNMFKRKVDVEFNCTSQYNITSKLITRGDNCIGYVNI